MYNYPVPRLILLALATTGWVANVFGALLIHFGGAKITANHDEGTFSIRALESLSKWGVTLVIIGTSVGAIGTILAIVQ